MELTPYYSKNQIVSVCQNFRPVASFFVLAKYHFWLFYTERVWPYRYAYDILLVTLVLNIYGFVGLAPFFFCS